MFSTKTLSVSARDFKLGYCVSDRFFSRGTVLPVQGLRSIIYYGKGERLRRLPEPKGK